MASPMLTHAAMGHDAAFHQKQGSLSRSTSAGSVSSPESQACLARAQESELPELDYPLPFTIPGCGLSPTIQDLGYPSPVIIKNTFLDSPVEMSSSLDGFFKQREIQSCPPGVIAPPPGLEGMSPALQGASPLLQAASPVLPCAEPGLAEVDYPVPMFVKSAFLDTPIDRPQTLEGLLLNSPSPGSRLTSVPEQEPKGLDLEELEQWQTPMPSHVWESPMTISLLDTLQAKGAAMLQELAMTGCEAAPVTECPVVPPPPAMWVPDFLPSVAMMPPPPMPYAHEAMLPPQVVSLAEALPTPQLGSPEAPTEGSLNHRLGNCKPCAFMHTKGCTNGSSCPFCHLCPPGERKRRQKQKQALEAKQQQLQL